jgi:hypothetical protein
MLECIARRLSLIGVGVVRLDGAGDSSVEVLFPEGRESFGLVSAGWPWVLGVDASGGPPHGYVADECGARVASRRSPDWLIVTLAGEVSNLAGEVGHVLCSLGQVVSPGRMVVNRVWKVWKPGQRSCFWCRECCEAPVEDGGQVSGGREIATAG